MRFCGDGLFGPRRLRASVESKASAGAYRARNAYSVSSFSGVFALLAVVSFGIAPLAARAQRQVTLNVQTPGDLIYSIKTAGSPASPPQHIDSAKPVSITVTGKSRTQIEVVNLKEGKVAVFPASVSATLDVKPADFTSALSFQVPVKYKDLGVKEMLVTLQFDNEEGKTTTERWWLQESDSGVARFSGVPLDRPLTIMLSTGLQSSEPISVRVRDAKNPPYQSEDVKVPEAWKGVKVVYAASPQTQAPAAVSSVPAPAPIQNNLWQIIVTIVIAVLALMGLVYWMVSRGYGPTFGPMTAQQEQNGMAVVGNQSRLEPIGGGTLSPFAENGGSGPRLVATMGTYAGTIFALEGNHITIGRETSNAVPLSQDQGASRRHAHIQFNNGQYILVDDGSTNGTYVNGMRIVAQKPHTLRPDDEVQVGYSRFKFLS